MRAGTAIGRFTNNPYVYGGISIGTIDVACTFYSTIPDNGLLLPAAPAWVSASDGEFTEGVKVIWAEVTGATGYIVGVAESDTAQPLFMPKTNATSMNIINLVPGHMYLFGVQTLNANGSGGFTFDHGYAAEPNPTATPINTPVPTATSIPPATQTPQPGVTPIYEKVYLPVTTK